MALQDGFSPSFWRKERRTITSSQTINTLSVSTESFRTAKYIFSFWNDSENKAKSMEMIVNNINSAITDSIYGRLGNVINVNVDAKINGGNMFIEITNNESYTVELDLAFITLGRA